VIVGAGTQARILHEQAQISRPGQSAQPFELWAEPDSPQTYRVMKWGDEAAWNGSSYSLDDRLEHGHDRGRDGLRELQHPRARRLRRDAPWPRPVRRRQARRYDHDRCESSSTTARAVRPGRQPAHLARVEPPSPARPVLGAIPADIAAYGNTSRGSTAACDTPACAGARERLIAI
jgi:hypothetical protein